MEGQIGATPAMKGDGSEEERLEIKLLTQIKLLEDVGSEHFRAEARRSLAHNIFVLCLVAAVVLGSCYFAFVGYITMEYAESWLEKLRMLPLLIAALTIPLLGALLIRKKHRIRKLVREAADVATVNCLFDHSVVGSTSDMKEASHMEISS